jgi:BRCA1-associated protein
VSECLESLQQVRTFLSSNYFSTVLLHFSNQSAADNFYTLFSGRDFSEPSNEYCYIGFIAETSYVKHLALKRDWKELPLCPICLERLDVNISGVAGVLRTESNSLVEKRWVEAIELCKVCKSLKLDEKDLPCEGCQEASDLWICLICGHKGCGRYQAAHGKKHFDETGHGFAIGLGSQRIWDYLNDNYVHRLLHSARGTMVLDSQFSQAAKENVERMINEYNHLIGLQLDQQRVFYEQKISTILTNKSETLHQEFKLAKSENDYLKRQISKIKACKRKKIIRESQLFDLLNENLELEALNKNLLEYVERPKELWTFEDKKSQTTYLKLERLKNELQSIMSTFT